ncbi:MAG TPA: FIST N-terminal domain-containing protein, partial [Nitrolancea sp.]|nr:FIST N-terminal domain-containing protein [Nitrolancea sp.]
ALVRRAREATNAGVLVGCSGQGIVGPEREVENEPAVSLLALSLPGVELHPVLINQQTLEACKEPGNWYDATGVDRDTVNGWFLFGDPFGIDAERLVDALSDAYPGTPLIGGLASGDPHIPRTYVFLDGDVYTEGAVAVALGGAYTVRTVVSQGAEPIGEPWTITAADEHIVHTIGQRPALEVLVETFDGLSPELQHRARRNLLVGLVMDEYQDEFRRGDFLIRNVTGYDPSTGALAIGAHPRVGQTIQFQLRDGRAADEELRTLLSQARGSLGDADPIAALVCCCNGRGAGLFGEPDHDARAIGEQFGLQSLAGFFCNGEIGPVGLRNYLHGYTASIAIIVPSS